MRRPALLAALAALLAAAGCSRKAEANYKHCLKLRVGMTKADMVKVMGEPEDTIPYVEGKSLPFLKGRTAYEWSNPATMPGGDHVSVDDASGKILSIRCSNSEVTASVFVEPPAPSTAAAAASASPAAAVAVSSRSAAEDLGAAVAAFTKKDLQQTLHLAKPLAVAENPDAQLLVGLVYLTADEVGLQGDKGEALKWIYRSSRNKNAVAAALYAATLKAGNVPAITVAQEAASAAELHHPAAEGLHASLLLNGYEDAVAQDVPAGEALLLKAAQDGDALSRLRLGERSQDVSKDVVQAYRWILLASRHPAASKFDDPLKADAFFWTAKDLAEANDRLKKLEPLMTPAQIKAAKNIADRPLP
jgi:outer membrane protein assembly factor BamE (lipoprotein component of BamABCDE complex)